MTDPGLRNAIEALWDRRDELSPATPGEAREAVGQALAALDSGAARVAEKGPAWLGGERVAEEGGAALVPAAGQRADAGAGRGAGL